ncbi:MAG TPA: FGGY-family carbohydrate kinase, partial [Abditibacteriaceae bacterium]
EIWRQIQADIFNMPLSTINIDEGPALGAALLAGVGAGLYSSVEEACSTVIKVTGKTPVSEDAALYDRYYDVYRALYPALKDQFTAIGELV